MKRTFNKEFKVKACELVIKDGIKHAVKEQYALEEENRIGTKHLDFVRDQVASIRDTWDFLTEQERQMVIRDCVDHINIYKDRVEIFYTFVKNEGAGTKAA